MVGVVLTKRNKNRIPFAAGQVVASAMPSRVVNDIVR